MFNFSEFFFDTFTIPVPETYEGVRDLEASEEKILENLEKQLQAEGSAYCALIVEPLIQGARGMVMHRPQFLEKLVKTVRKFGILVIFDEVFTGFYRTGRFFAMDHVSEKPDIVCLSQALTGGFLPLSLTIATDEIYNESQKEIEPGYYLLTYNNTEQKAIWLEQISDELHANLKVEIVSYQS